MFSIYYFFAPGPPKLSQNRPETARVQNRYFSKGSQLKIDGFSIPGRSRPGPALRIDAFLKVFNQKNIDFSIPGRFRPVLLLALCCLLVVVHSFVVGALLFERLSPLPGVRISTSIARPPTICHRRRKSADKAPYRESGSPAAQRERHRIAGITS